MLVTPVGRKLHPLHHNLLPVLSPDADLGDGGLVCLADCVNIGRVGHSVLGADVLGARSPLGGGGLGVLLLTDVPMAESAVSADDVPDRDLNDVVGDGALFLAEGSLLDGDLGLGHLGSGGVSATVLSSGVSVRSHAALRVTGLVALLGLDGCGVGVGNLDSSVDDYLFLDHRTLAETFHVTTGRRT